MERRSVCTRITSERRRDGSKLDYLYFCVNYYQDNVCINEKKMIN